MTKYRAIPKPRTDDKWLVVDENSGLLREVSGTREDADAETAKANMHHAIAQRLDPMDPLSAGWQEIPEVQVADIVRQWKRAPLEGSWRIFWELKNGTIVQPRGVGRMGATDAILTTLTPQDMERYCAAHEVSEY